MQKVFGLLTMSRPSLDALSKKDAGHDLSGHEPAQEDSSLADKGHTPIANSSLAETQFTSIRPPTDADAAVLANGLKLAGRPLEPPRFYGVSWKRGEYFTARDDPDRTAMAWEAPRFIQCNPAERHARLSVEELTLPHKPCRHSFARVVRGALTEEECASLISAVNVKGFTPALVNMGGGRQQLRPDARDGFRVIVDSIPLTEWLLEVLRPHLPPKVEFGGRLDSLNERCRFLCYTPGQEFTRHHDAAFRHPQTKAQSFVTVQLYLHDVDPDSGGATTFISEKAKSEREKQKSSVKCQPGAGSVLIFSQDLLHEGSLLKRGLKYTFRTEAMYK